MEFFHNTEQPNYLAEGCPCGLAVCALFFWHGQYRADLLATSFRRTSLAQPSQVMPGVRQLRGSSQEKIARLASNIVEKLRKVRCSSFLNLMTDAQVWQAEKTLERAHGWFMKFLDAQAY
eukprot:1144937-Pelagomonas_calceolata.AAC.1